MSSRWPRTTYRNGNPNDHLRVFLEDLELEVDLGGERVVALVPRGYDAFNGASIPRALWSAVGHPYLKGFERAAAVHDYLYDTPLARADPRYRGLARTRRQVDQLFEAILLLDGVRPARASAMYSAVRLAGQAYFTDDRSNDRARFRANIDERAMADRIKAMAEASLAQARGDAPDVPSSGMVRVMRDMMDRLGDVEGEALPEEGVAEIAGWDWGWILGDLG